MSNQAGLPLTCPHLLKVLDDCHVRIHEPPHAILNARLLVFIQFAIANIAGNALQTY